MSKIMVEKLTKYPEFRERSKRDVYLAKWVLREITEFKEFTDEHGNLQKKEISLLDKQKAGQMFTMGELGKFGIRFASLDRTWRQTLEKEENKHLRGSDYSKKDELETQAQRNLGYNV